MKKFLHHPLFPECAAFLAVLIVFSPALFFGFLTQWDDSSYVLDNPALAFTFENFLSYFRSCPQNFYAPLTMHSFLLDHLVWDLHPAGYHLTNLILHGLAAVLFVRILKHLGLRPVLALAMALFWALHPQRIESVVWISERKDVLSGVLALGAILAFFRAFDRKRFSLLPLVLYVLACLAKPSVIGVPVIWLLYAVRERGFRVWKWLIPAGLLCGGAGLLILKIMHFSPAWESPGRVAEILAHNVCFYAGNTLLPLFLSPVYPLVEGSDVLCSCALAVLCLLVLTLVWKKSGGSWPELGMLFLTFGIAYLAFFSTVSGGFQFNATDYADRYSYLPSLCVWACLGFLLEKLLRRNGNCFPAVRIVLIAAGFLILLQTFLYLPAWRNDETLSSAAVSRTVRVNDKAILHRFKAGVQKRDPAITEESALLMLNNASRHFPRDGKNVAVSRTLTGMGFLFFSRCFRDQKQEAIQLFRQIRALYRQYGGRIRIPEQELYLGSFRSLAMPLLAECGTPGELYGFLEWTERGRLWDDRSAVDWFYRGLLAMNRKQYPRAVFCWKHARQLSPEDPSIRANLETAERLCREQALPDGKKSALP